MIPVGATRRRLARAAVALAALVALAAGAAPARAQTPRGGAPDAELRLEGLTGVLRPEGELRVQVRVDNLDGQSLDGLRVVATLHRKASSRFDFQQAVDDGAVGTVRAALGADIDVLEARASRSIDLVEAAANLGFAQPADKYGVYPLRLQLQQDGEVLDEVHTSVVLAPSEVAEPVAVALVVPLDTPPGLQADGSHDAARVARDLGPGAPLGRLVDELAAPSGVPLTVATSGLLLEQAADLADGFTASDPAGPRVVPAEAQPALDAAGFLAALRRVLARGQVQHVALPYGPADLVALVRGGMNSEVTRHISEGRLTSGTLTGDRPEPGLLWPPDGLDAATLAEAMGAGIDAVVLSERRLQIPADRELPFSPSPVRRLRTGTGASVDVLVPDPWIEDLLDSGADDGPVAAAQRVLAETAAVYFERPNASRQRGLLLAPPQVWAPAPGTLGALLAGIAQAPWVRPVTVTQLAAAVAADDDPTALAYPSRARARELDTGYVAALREARRGLGTLTGLLPEADATPARFDRLLLTAAAVHYRPVPLRAEGRAMIRTVSDSVARLQGSVAVTDGLPVTMTSVEGPVPVTLRNAAPVPLRVQVRLESARFEFPDGAVRTVDIGAGATATLTVRARAVQPGGTSPLRVIVTDAGGRVLTTGTVVVRSTAYSLVALGITGAAAAFLLLWWVRDARRRRRLQRAEGTPRERTAAA